MATPTSSRNYGERANPYINHGVCNVYEMPPSVAVYSRCAASGNKPRVGGDIAPGSILWDEDMEQPLDLRITSDKGLCFVPFLSNPVITPGAISQQDSSTQMSAGFVPTAFDMSSHQRTACQAAAVSYLAPPLPACRLTE